MSGQTISNILNNVTLGDVIRGFGTIFNTISANREEEHRVQNPQSNKKSLKIKTAKTNKVKKNCRVRKNNTEQLAKTLITYIDQKFAELKQEMSVQVNSVKAKAQPSVADQSLCADNQLDCYDCYVDKLKTSLVDLQGEAKLLGLNYKNKTQTELTNEIYTNLQRNSKKLDKYSKLQLLKFATRHKIPRTQMDLQDLDCIRSCIKRELAQSQQLKNKSVGEFVDNKAFMGGKSQLYRFELNGDCSGDYNDDATRMFSKNMKHLLKVIHSQTGPFSIKVTFEAQVEWLNRGEIETITQTLKQSYKVQFATDVNSQFEQMKNDLILRISQSELQGSGWVYLCLNWLELNVKKYDPSTGSSYLELPKQLKSKRAFINVQNKDEYCFKYAVLSCLHPVKTGEHSYRTKNYEKYLNTMNWDGLEFPLELNKNKLTMFEKKNPELPPLNMFYLENHDSLFPLPYYTSIKPNCNAPNAINLLYFQDDTFSKGHYVYIKSLSKCFSSLTKHDHKKYICVKCLSCHTSQEMLEKHDEFCDLKNPTHLKIPDKKHKFVEFNRFETTQDLPVYIVCDTESISKSVNYCKGCKTYINESELDNHAEHGTMINEEHIPIGYGMYTVVSEKYRKIYEGLHGKYESYTGVNVGHHLITKLRSTTKEIYSKIAKVKKNISSEDYKLWKDKLILKETKCHICTKEIAFAPHLDHDHLTGEVRGWAHSTCNLRNTIKNKCIPILFHNLKGYDSKAFVRDLTDFKDIQTEVIAENSEKFKSITCTCFEKRTMVSKFRFIDTLAHLSTSLQKLTEAIRSGENDVEKLRIKFPSVSSEFPNDEQFQLILRKGVFPYNWFNDSSKLEHTELLNIKDFYDKLGEKAITVEDYEFYKTVMDKFECKTFRDYYELYLKLDVILLADICIHYKKECLDTYGLEPFWFITSPALSWNAMLKHTGAKLELFTDINMYHCIQNSIRGGLSFVANRYCNANNPESKDYDPRKPISCINYVDMNNLYGFAMGQSLPIGDYKWIETDKILKQVKGKGRIYCVDLEVPKELHDYLKDFPPAPYSITPEGSTEKKLITDLTNKEKYVVLDQLLDFYVKLGLKVTKVHYCIEFKAKAFLKPYIKLNSKKRQESGGNEFRKNHYKLQNNAIYGKTIQDVTKYRNYEIVNHERYSKLLRQPHLLQQEIALKQCDNCKQLGSAEYGKCQDENGCCICVERVKSSVYLNMPIIIGFAVLELSKLKMYQTWYEMKDICGDKLKLLYHDTDSFIYSIEIPSNIEHFKQLKHMFDFSNYDKEHSLYNSKLALVPGYLKNEHPNNTIDEFAGLRSKCYSITFTNDEENKVVCKGVRARNKLRHQMYKDCLVTGEDVYVDETHLRSEQQTMYRMSQRKKALCSEDSKRIWIGESEEPFSDNYGNTLPFGHYSLLE